MVYKKYYENFLLLKILFYIIILIRGSMKKIILLTIASVFVLTNCSSASHKMNKEVRMKQCFAKRDTNKDGKISQDEWKAQFTAMNTNSKGDHAKYADLQEFIDYRKNLHAGMKMPDHHKKMDEAAKKEKQKKHFDKHDPDKDGKITEEEWNKHLEAMDTNKDGSVDFKEFFAHKPKMKAEMKK